MFMIFALADWMCCRLAIWASVTPFRNGTNWPHYPNPQISKSSQSHGVLTHRSPVGISGDRWSITISGSADTERRTMIGIYRDASVLN